MNAKKVKLELYQCGICGGYFKTESSANLCCPVCKCGEPRKKGYIACEKCLNKSNELRDQLRLKHAETIDECQLETPYMLHDDNEFYESVEHYLECHAWGDEFEPDQYLFVGSKHIPWLDASDIVCGITDRMYEDAELPVEAMDVLDKACFKVNSIIIQKGFCSFEMSWKQKVKVNEVD